MIESAARRLASELVDRRESINRELSRNGVRFGIYKNGEYHDRLFPYDPIPRIIESDEFDRMEAGLKQRVNALNAYLRDIYSDKQAIKDGIVPEEYVYTSAGYFPQVNGVTPPGGVFAHIAGEDLVQGQDGRAAALSGIHREEALREFRQGRADLPLGKRRGARALSEIRLCGDWQCG